MLDGFGSFGAAGPLVECALARDTCTQVHVLHVNRLALRWAPHLQLDPARRRTFVHAALLHDIGKVFVPEAILRKPAKLHAHEYAVIRHHPEFGRALLCGYDGFAEVARIVGQHHEHWNGAGYPSGLRGERIDLLARAVAVIDAFSAMTLDRPYHRAVEAAEAIGELERCAGTQFDPALVASFAALERAAV